MLLWFLVLAPVIVAEVFQSPMADYRFVAVGALLPLVELVFGGPKFLHTMPAAILVLGLVMAATTGRRLLRRQLLGVPIGMFLHLVLDGSWTSKELMWWPLFGVDFPQQRLPEFQRPALGIGLELAAVGVAFWAYRRYELDNSDNLRLLRTSGRLNRAAMP